MKRKINLKKISTIGLSAAMAATLAFGAAFSDLSLNGAGEIESANDNAVQTVEGGTNSNSVSKNESTASTYAAATLIADDASGLNLFPTGATYWYTDYAEGVKIGDAYATSGTNADGATDRKIVTVNNLSTNKGTVDNPYVINSKDDWNDFVTFTATAANQSLTYVLNCDLDYGTTGTDGTAANGEIKSVSTFSGKFYGNGHKISNAKYVASNALNNHALGLFCRAVGSTAAVIFADLTIENLLVPSSAVGHVGGLVGHSDGHLTVTGVTVTGSMTATNPALANVNSVCNGSPYIGYGGLLGAGHGASKTTNIYKCATNVNINISNSNKLYVGAGGMIGLFDGYSAGFFTTALNIYDCFSSMKLNYTCYSGTMQLWSGMVGFLRSVATSTMKRCLSVSDVTANASYNLSPGIFFTVGESAANTTSKYVVDYCYGYGNFHLGTTHKALPFVGKYMETRTTGTFTNCKIYSDYLANGYFSNTSSHVTNGNGLATMNTEPHKGAVSSIADLKEAATGIKVTRDSDGNIISKTVTNDKAPLGNTLIWTPTTVEEIKSPMILPDIVEKPILSMIVVPEDTELVYTGEQIDLTGAPWYTESVHGNTDVMTYSTGGMVNAGEYTVTFNLKSGLTWNDGTTGSKSIKVKVNPRKLTIAWETPSGGAAVAKITAGLANKDISNPPTIDLTYYKDGVQLSGFPETVGTYTVKASIAAGGNYKLKDDGEEDPSYTFYLAAIPIKTPTVSGTTSQMYTGEDITFLLMNCEPIEQGKVADLSQAKMPAGATYNYDEATNERTITVKAAGTYPIKFTLMDQTNTCWADGSGVLNLVVEKRPINLTLNREGSWEQFETNTQETFTITHDAVDGDNIRLSIEYVKPDGTVVTVGNDRIKTEGKISTVTLDRLDRGEHTIRVAMGLESASNANKNYELKAGVIEQPFKVIGKQINADDLAASIEWQYSDGRETKPLTKGQGIDYNGRTVTVSIKTDRLAEQGVRISEYENQTGVNVGTYTTRVLLTKLNDTYEFEDKWFEINWEILKAIFDLSEVEWDYTGPIGYTGNVISVRLKNVPDALTATYGTGSTGREVTGEGYNTAEVTFKLKNSADVNNYTVPSGKVSSGTYKYKEGEESFPWTKQWQIKKGTIAMNWDLQGGYRTDDNGVGFTYPVLLSGEKYINYEFYKTERNAAGNYEPVGSAVSLDSISVTPNERETYCVKVVLKADAENNFELGTEGDNPKHFIVGDYRTGIAVTVVETERMYNGKRQPIDFEVVDASEHELTKENGDFEITYLDENGIMLDGAPINAGTYTAIISVKDKGTNAEKYYVSKNSRYRFEIKKFTISASDLKWNYDPTEPFVYTRVNEVEKRYTVTLAGVPSTLNLVYTNNEFSAAGTYKAEVQFDIANVDEEVKKNLNLDAIVNVFKNDIAPLNWEIQKRELTVPNTLINPITYDGSPNDLIALLGLDSDWAEYLSITVKKDALEITLEEARRAANAGTYTITCSIMGAVLNSVVWKGGNAMAKETFIEITPARITVTGWQGKPAQPKFKDGGREQVDVVYKLEDGTVLSLADILAKKYLEVKIYATVEPKSDMIDNVWIDYDENVEASCMFIMFKGGPTSLKFPELVIDKLSYNFANQEFEIKDWDNVYNGKVTVLGANGDETPLKVDGKFIGKRTVKIALRGDRNVEWADHSTDIYELVIEVVRGNLSQEWELDEKGRPVLSFADMEVEFDIASIVEYKYRDMNGMLVSENKLKEGVDYKAIATIKSAYADYFCFGYSDDEEGEPKISSDAFEFTFGVTENPNPVPPPVDDGNTGDKNDENTNTLPLWQLIVGGISAVLFVVCAAKSFGEYGKYKTAKKEAKELASVSYITTYGFAPLPLMAIAFLGLGETPWTIIAFVALGLFLLSLAALLVLTKKRKAAELTLKREQARVAEEKEYAREEEQMRREEQLREEQRQREEQMREEQMRRDNEFKMMFAAMQQGYQQPAMNYDDMRGLLAETVSALLPAMQQMQALPPAQDPSQYAAPAQYAPPAQYAAPSSETEELRAQMAAQQAQMAQQQELINQLLQNQQAAQASAAYASEYDAALEAENARQEELLRQFDPSETPVSLEESYGNLSDEAKRFYYDIGCFIMERPNVMQNDGKYAVLFKYRGKTLFKLNIKSDAPVLTYIANGAPVEQPVTNANELAYAKQIMANCIAQTDRELDG